MDEIKKIEVQGQQYGIADMLMRGVMGGNAQTIEWSHTHNMNDYKVAGTYRIKGERTGSPMDDNLPIMNSGSGHTLDGVLYVLDSSLTNGTGETTDCTVTQFLMLSNRVGGQEGDMYMRSAYGNTKDNLTWKPWEKYQTNMEVGCVSEGNLLNPDNPTQVLQFGGGMCYLMDNGIYSGIYLGPKTMIGTTEDENTIVIKDPTAIETFVMIVINNYLAAKDAKSVTQIKFSVTNGGVFSMEKRVSEVFYEDKWGNNTVQFSQWELIGGTGTNAYIGKDVYIDDGVRINGRMSIFANPDSYQLDNLMGTSAVEGKSVKLPYGLNAQNVTWDHTSNANTFTTQGYYLITGERTAHQQNDNLPLSDTTLGSGHTLRMVLTVLDSSLLNVGNDSKDCCITQILQCSNRTGGDGNVYVRTASGVDKNNLTWEPWGKLQTNVEVGQVTSLDPFIDNGMYSGVYTDGATFAETFVLVTINNYAAAGESGVPRSISQFKYSLNVDGTVTMKYRVRSDSDGNWRDWQDISDAKADIANAIKEYGISNLIMSGYIKHGVNYKATFYNIEDFNGKLDPNNKIYEHLKTYDNELVGPILFERITYNTFAGPHGVVIDVINYEGRISFRYMYNNVHSTSCVVKVSAGMTTLE